MPMGIFEQEEDSQLLFKQGENTRSVRQLQAD